MVSWTIGTSNCLKHISLCAPPYPGKAYPMHPFRTFVPLATPLDRTNMNPSAPGLEPSNTYNAVKLRAY